MFWSYIFKVPSPVQIPSLCFSPLTFAQNVMTSACNMKCFPIKHQFCSDFHKPLGSCPSTLRLIEACDWRKISETSLTGHMVDKVVFFFLKHMVLISNIIITEMPQYHFWKLTVKIKVPFLTTRAPLQIRTHLK